MALAVSPPGWCGRGTKDGVPDVRQLVIALVPVHGYSLLQFSDLDSLLNPPTFLVVFPVDDFNAVEIHDVIIVSGVF